MFTMAASDNQENSKPRDTANTDISTKLTRHLVLIYLWPCDVSAVWRDANIFPVSKKGKTEDPANYRQISDLYGVKVT